MQGSAVNPPLQPGLEIIHDALAQRFLPVFDDIQVDAEFADGLSLQLPLYIHTPCR
jgi:hypothetical protein